MAVIKNLDVVLRAKNDKLQKDLDKSNRLLSKSLSKMNRMARTGGGGGGRNAILAGGVAGLTAAGITSALGGLRRISSAMKGLVGHSVSLAMNWERMQVGFKVLTGSSAAGDKMLNKLQDFAVNTPFRQDEVFLSGKKLLAASVAQSDIATALGFLGDASAAVDANIGEVTQIYTKVLQKGKLQQEEFLQFAERAINLMPALEIVLGKSSAEIKQMQKDGLVTSAHVTKAFKIMNSEGGMFFNAMNLLSKTMSARFNTLKDKIDIVMRRLGERAAPAIKFVTEELISFVDTLIAGGSEMKSIGDHVQKFSEYLLLLKPGIEIVAASIRGMVNDLAGLIPVMETIGGSGGLMKFLGLDRFGDDLQGILDQKRFQMQLKIDNAEFLRKKNEAENAGKPKAGGMPSIDAAPIAKEIARQNLASAGFGTQEAFRARFGVGGVDDVQSKILAELKRRTS